MKTKISLKTIPVIAILLTVFLSGTSLTGMGGSGKDQMTGDGNNPGALTAKEQLGKLLFYDAKLSMPDGMSCATCHNPTTAFVDPLANAWTGYPTSPGVIRDRFGSRNTPPASYAFGGPQELKQYNRSYAGGTFWDGRANNLAEQSLGPFLNPIEMNNNNKALVVLDVALSRYAGLFKQVYGQKIFSNVSSAYTSIGDAIAAYEMSEEVNPCTAKIDYFMEGKVALTPMERMGMMIFHGKGGCTMCHFSGQQIGRKCAGGCSCGCAYTGVCKCADCNCGCPAKGETTCAGGCTCGCAVTGVCTCGPGCTCGCLQSNANACAGGCTCGCAFTGICNCGAGCQCGCSNEARACEGGCACGCWWTGICNCGGTGCDCGDPNGGMIFGKPLFTNHGYFNLGTPKNPDNPFYKLNKKFNPLGGNFVDYGLGAVLKQRKIPGYEEQMGKFKVPSLRNVAKTAPYMHNGVFADLKSVIKFYNTRDVPEAGWGPPEVNMNVFSEINYGNLGLTETEIDALVAFLGTFSDGYKNDTSINP